MLCLNAWIYGKREQASPVLPKRKRTFVVLVPETDAAAARLFFLTTTDVSPPPHPLVRVRSFPHGSSPPLRRLLTALQRTPFSTWWFVSKSPAFTMTRQWPDLSKIQNRTLNEWRHVLTFIGEAAMKIGLSSFIHFSLSFRMKSRDVAEYQNRIGMGDSCGASWLVVIGWWIGLHYLHQQTNMQKDSMRWLSAVICPIAKQTKWIVLQRCRGMQGGRKSRTGVLGSLFRECLVGRTSPFTVACCHYKGHPKRKADCSNRPMILAVGSSTMPFQSYSHGSSPALTTRDCELLIVVERHHTLVSSTMTRQSPTMTGSWKMKEPAE